MRIGKLTSRLTIIVAAFVIGVVTGPIAAAEGFTSPSYFENSGTQVLIGPYYENSNSINGSVMPNRHTGWFNRDDPGDILDYTQNRQGGALGNWSLGINQNTNNRDRKQALYDYLRRNNDSGTPWERMGSAFIVHQMTGRSWGVGGRDIPDPQWDELYGRLVQNDNVRMIRGEYDWRTNTSGVLVNGSTTDARGYSYDFSNQVDAWIFEVNGSTRYVLEVICANPLGSLPGLPPAEYELIPTASPNRTEIEVGGSVSVTNAVENTDSVQSNQTYWRLTKIEYDPGVNLSPNDRRARFSDSDPCSTFPFAGPGRCTEEQRSPQEVFNANSTRTFSPVYSYTAPPNVRVGTKVCFVASVSRPTRSGPDAWRHSTLRCVIVSKKPKMQIWGGDVRTGGQINTSITTISGPSRTFGSWGEYAALSNQRNSGFASGAGLNDGDVSNGQSGWSNLTFANSNTSCTFGCYGFSPYAPSLTGQFTSSSSYPLLTGSVDLTGLIGDTPYRANSLTISGGSIGTGKSIIIVATGTVTIGGDIRYSDGPYTNVSDIPQVIIRARTINIAGSVGNVDAWLLADPPSGTGTLNTCSDVLPPSARLTIFNCDRPLRVNGPIVADRLYLRRTAGAAGGLATLDDPAEIFNLRADAYLWGVGYGDGGGKIQTVHTRELPPRF